MIRSGEPQHLQVAVTVGAVGARVVGCMMGLISFRMELGDVVLAGYIHVTQRIGGLFSPPLLFTLKELKEPC